MTKAYAVIGANYGDEGKGVATDWLCRTLTEDSEEDVVVVRFNGGAQAGHTVVNNGRRHVFGHVGSGFFTGAKTHLSKFFISNPMRFETEFTALLGQVDNYEKNSITVDPKSRVTTPWDMILNQLIERWRRGNTTSGGHGSCGMGINETVVRSDLEMFALTAEDLLGDGLHTKLQRIQEEWFPARFHKVTGESLRDPTIYEQIGEILSVDWMSLFLQSVDFFNTHVRFCYDEQISNLGTVVFEGAQGLGLDEFRGKFPHVTRGRTGLANVEELADKAGISEIDAYYMTRCYLSRHGRGPMDYEGEDETHHGVSLRDDTNHFNIWQEHFRTQMLSPEETADRIYEDIRVLGSSLLVNEKLVITHLDNLPSNSLAVIWKGKREIVTPNQLADMFIEALGLSDDDIYGCYGAEGRICLLSDVHAASLAR